MSSHPEKLRIPRKRAIGLSVARRAGAKLPFDQRIGINPPLQRGQQIKAIKRKINV